MTVRTAPIIAAMLLAACSSEAPLSADDDAAPAATPETAPAAADRVTAGTTGAMTGQVSDLAGDVSGLDVRVTDLGTIIDLPADALFEFDKADLTPAAEDELRKAAELIRTAPAGAIQVTGHTDAKGDDAYNQRLSEARARAVADWFDRQVGVRQREFTISGKGETAPIAPNTTPEGKDDPAGRTRNRRVEVILPR